MSIKLFKAQCPGVFTTLARLLEPTALFTISTDYGIAAMRQANQEPEMRRVDGVSFNPRLGRILMILLRDGGVRDPIVFRAALCALADITPGEYPELPNEVLALVQTIQDGGIGDERALLIRMACDLDAIRHLHMTSYSVEQRDQVLLAKEREEYLRCVPKHLEALAGKVLHATHLQRQRLARDIDRQRE